MAELMFFVWVALLVGATKVISILLDWTYPSLTKEEKDFANRNKNVKPW